MKANLTKNVFNPCFILAGLFLMVTLAVNGQNSSGDQASQGLRISVFDIDATPPVGTILAYNPEINTWDLGLRARGIVLQGSELPIVLCGIDWLGIGDEGHDAFCEELAKAAGTTPDRVAVHTLHQHDAPGCDFGAEKILRDAGLNPIKYEGTFQRQVIKSLSEAVKNSLSKAQPLTSVGYGQAQVYKVASNRRIIDKNGLCIASRTSSCTDPALRAKPEGLIDPFVQLISFWNGDKPVAVLSYYATHPQSYYRTGIPNPDFPGIARFMRQLAVPQALHIHFNGAAGNVTAGKYNDGSHKNRLILAERLADGMKRAWESTTRIPAANLKLSWTTEPVALPPAKDLFLLQDKNFPPDSLAVKTNAARLAFLRRCQEGKKISIGCLSLGNIRILHLPGEAFIEYQLAAKAERRDLFVAVAAYGEYGTGYIGTAIAYKQGGYETGYVSKVSPESENILMGAIKKLLKEK